MDNEALSADMTRPRRTYSPEFKAEVAIAAVRASRSLAQLSRDFGVHRNQVKQWRDRLIDRAGKLFVERIDSRLSQRRRAAGWSGAALPGNGGAP